VEIETRELNSDGTAETRARELSTSEQSPVIVHRLHPAVDDWEYVTEVDDRH
jgi:hypothetical protein